MPSRHASLRSFLLLAIPAIVCVIVSVIIVGVDLIPMNVVKGYVYVVCTVLQTAFVILNLCWWQRKIRNEDQKKERQTAEEEKQKADTEKIIAIFSSDYYGKAKEAHQILKTHLDALESRKINTGQSTRTELDVLVYMCHKFNESNTCNSTTSRHSNDARFQSTHESVSSDRHEYGKENVMFDVCKIKRFFEAFYYRLNGVDEKCPDTIKSVFSSKVIEMGKTIYPFITGNDRMQIEKISNYFNPTNSVQDHPESATQANISPICLLCCCPQSNTEQHSAEQPLVGSDETRQGNQQAMQSIPDYSYPGHDELKNEIPYIEFFRYEDCEMDFNIECKHSNLKNLESYVKWGKREILDRKDEIKNEIVKLLGSEQASQQITCDQEYLLHLIRIVMLKIKKNELNNERKRIFIEYVRGIDCGLVSVEDPIKKSKRALDDIQTHVKHLKETHKYILKLKGTPGFLETKAEEIRAYIADRINVHKITT